MKKILTIIGARPLFIKASAVSKAIQETDGLTEVLVNTDQHFDANMSDIFSNNWAFLVLIINSISTAAVMVI